MSRMSVLLLLSLLLSPLSNAKDKKKAVLPAYVLKAQSVLVVIPPDAGEPLTDVTADRRAREDVEKAVMKWGRFRIASDAQTADLVIAVRKGTGQLVSPTIGGGPMDGRPVIVQPTDGNGRVGGQQGRPPDLTQPGMGGPEDSPRANTEIGRMQDTFEVYRGGVEHPLDGSAIWRYNGRDALRAPGVPAVEQFRKAIDDAEKAQKQSKPTP